MAPAMSTSARTVPWTRCARSALKLVLAPVALLIACGRSELELGPFETAPQDGARGGNGAAGTGARASHGGSPAGGRGGEAAHAGTGARSAGGRAGSGRGGAGGRGG